ncbi:MAG: hypothetical protein LBF86_04665 [Helicobacteraceae bacterium]|jgi:hypothetical protein|nr:hypothetical protein [Helicobacteraceae bacterium]
MYAFSHNLELPMDNSSISYLSAMNIAFESEEEICEEIDLSRVQAIGVIDEGKTEETKLAA